MSRVAPVRGRVLLVDDEEPLRRAYGSFLRRAHFEVEEAASGAVATEKLMTGRFDLVISDVRLPDTSGLDLLRRTRAHDASVPVVLMTGWAELGSAVQAVEAGALHFLMKPVERAVLCAAAEDGVRAHERACVGERALSLSTNQTAEDPALRADADHLQRALPTLRMAYQPIVRLSTREVVAYEALIRPQDRDLATPEQLCRLATRAGRLSDVGRRVRAEIAAALSSASDDVRVFVNVHPSDLGDPELFDRDAPLSKHARRVTLEITEQDAFADLDLARRRVGQLRELDYKVAIADFGTGCGGLDVFTELRPEVAKLAMFFTRGIADDARKQKLVRRLAELCADTDTLLVTEGVETTGELDVLRTLGCDVFQGWLVGMPAAPFVPVAWDGLPRPRGGFSTARAERRRRPRRGRS